MARHADQRSGRQGAGSRRRPRVSLPALVVCLLVIGAVVLGVWWWNLRSADDPIAADPVDAYATVVSSPSCPSGVGTKVEIAGLRPPVVATLSGCGFATDQRLAVQYLRGHPQDVRLAGSSVSGGSGLAGKLLPIGILAAGLIAVLAALALLVDRRRSRHLASATGISVADLRTRGAGLGGSRAAGRASGGGGGGRGGGAGTGGSGPPGSRGSSEAGGQDGDGGGGSNGGDGGDGGAGGPVADLGSVDPGEPAHVLPGGFVIIDEQLFTHSGSEVTIDPQGDGTRADPAG